VTFVYPDPVIAQKRALSRASCFFLKDFPEFLSQSGQAGPAQVLRPRTRSFRRAHVFKDYRSPPRANF
jgi:hypothetical protein